jgi:hypothetical protein
VAACADRHCEVHKDKVREVFYCWAHDNGAKEDRAYLRRDMRAILPRPGEAQRREGGKVVRILTGPKLNADGEELGEERQLAPPRKLG